MADARDRHPDHDPLLIVSLLDGDPAASERAVAEALVADCYDCAALHADLVLLASATRVLPTPPRPRDFRLTAADAARLAVPVAGEPAGPTPRLTGEMTATTTSSSHAAHDTMLVASLTDRSPSASEREAAEALVASCGLCSALHADLVALRTATRAMPMPTRPRDYTLTPTDAARLRPSGWRRFVAAFGSSRDVFSRPLAVGLTTLGLAGLLVATVPSIVPGLASRALPTAADSATSGNGSAGGVTNRGPEAGSVAPAVPGAAADASAGLAPAAAASGAPRPLPSGQFGIDQTDRGSVPPDQSVTSVGSSNGSAKGSATAQPIVKGETDVAADTVAAAPSGISPLIVVSVVFLVAGLSLFAVRRGARHLGD